MTKENNIEIYTDGSSLGNPGPGGWGVVVTKDGKIIKEFGDFSDGTTNNKMELQGAIEALRYVKENNLQNVILHTDSSYVLGGITSWIFNWEKNGWIKADKKPVLNKEIWQELSSFDCELKGRISWQKVKGHSGHELNDRADFIATTCAGEQKKF